VEALSPVTADPSRSALFFDVDGTLAPIVERAEDAQVPKDTALLLARLSRRYARVACVSGRAAAEVRRLVGVGGIEYSGLHGAELIEPERSEARLLPDFARFRGEVQAFARERDTAELRVLRVRIEDKGPIVSFHWRGARDEEAAHARVKEIADAAVAEGLWTHWGRKVLEIRPPVQIGKDRAVAELLERDPVAVALYAGDDLTDLDAFSALAEAVQSGELEDSVSGAVSSDEAPEELIEQADLVVDGIGGMQQVLAELDSA
jgi:trehalose 6-phosphate phosphatase